MVSATSCNFQDINTEVCSGGREDVGMQEGETEDKERARKPEQNLISLSFFAHFSLRSEQTLAALYQSWLWGEDRDTFSSPSDIRKLTGTILLHDRVSGGTAKLMNLHCRAGTQP